MKKINFNADWLFSRTGDEANAKAVRLPHDAMIYEERRKDSPTAGASGYFLGGCYTYTKRFTAPKEWADCAVILEPEAVYKNSSVLLNGEKLAERPYGYTNYFVDLTGKVKSGEENELTIIADNSKCPNTRWYSGSGVYRDVNLYVGALAHIVPDGLQVTTEENRTVRFKAEVTGGEKLHVKILDGEDTIGIMTVPVENNTASGGIGVGDVRLWDAENPNLYTFRAELYEGGKCVDTEEVTFGFRTLSWSTKGFFVNGKETLFRGACVHHDNGILGGASFYDAEERRIRLLKEAGFNAVRSSHNPASRAMLEACDRLGMYVMDELVDHWLIHKNPFDYADEDFRAWWERDLSEMIRKNYNHPSVVMTSIGNEISELGLTEGQEMCRKMVAFCKELDPGRPVTLGVNLMLADMAAKGKGLYGKDKNGNDKTTGSQSMDNAPTSEFYNALMNKMGDLMDMAAAGKSVDKATSAAFAALDIGGYNYATSRYVKDGKLHPERIIVGSETLPKYLYKNWQLVKELPYLIGDFMWTGWDYLGESGIGTVQYKSMKDNGLIVSGGAGVIDICGKLRPEVQWNRLIWDLTKQPEIAVDPYSRVGDKRTVAMWRDTDAVASWAWDGCEGKKQNVTVYSNGTTAELVVNGSSLGKKKVKSDKAIFRNVTYVPGTVTAVSYDASGKELGRVSYTSATGKTSIRLVAEKPELRAGSDDLCFVRVELVGENGVIRSASDRQLTVEVTGAGTLQAFGSSRPNITENFYSGVHTTYYGQALAAVRAGAEAGDIRVKVSGKGLEDAEVVIRTV